MNVLRHFSSTYRLYKNQKKENRIKAKQNKTTTKVHCIENKKKTKNCLLKSCLTRCGAYSLCSAPRLTDLSKRTHTYSKYI